MKKEHEFHKNIVQRLLSKEEGSVAISVISLSEISVGIERGKITKDKKQLLLKALQNMLSSIIVLEFSEESAWIYGNIRSNIIDSGQDIGSMDTLIAAQALSQKLVLVSNNLKHFQRIPQLKIENWTE